jgi:hypothetical protein
MENALLDSKIDINDLGMQNERNRLSFTGNLSYNNYTPSSWYSRYNFSVTPLYIRRFLPGTYEKASLSLNGMLLLKDYTMFRLSGAYAFPTKDFYEPKKEGRLYNKPEGVTGSFYVSTNYNKPVFVDVTLNYETFLQNSEHAYTLELKPGFRISQKVTLFITSKLNNMFHNRGFYATAGNAKDTVIFASRNRSVVENVVDGRFSFNNKMNITLAARHYVSKVKNEAFFLLNPKGDLETTHFTGREGDVYNLFYIDFLYTWRFAQGSEFNFIWKNEINPQGVDTLYDSYFRDLSFLSNAPQRNLLTLKLIYYLDWMTIFGKRSGG